MSADRTLIAGIGNIFLGDDGFGVEVARRLRAAELPPGTDLVDTGIRGVDLAYRMLDGYHTVIMVDTVERDGPPGTVQLIEPQPAASGEAGAPVVDGHRMTPDAVLALLGTLGAGTGAPVPSRVLVVGCVPGSLDEGIGLGGPVAAAVEEAADLVLDLLGREASGAPSAAPHPDPTVAGRTAAGQ